ncbi:MAG TPA: metal-dependent hydrolase [Thermoleophilaceae bacterium]|nr:metal-dependent hydrolase [Thermoleophilaceae bacterium]
MEIRFLGQSCFELAEGEARVLIDPFLTGNPKAGASAEELEPTHILLTHGHADHYGDTVEIAKRTGALVAAVPELANEIAGKGVENVVDPNLGGTIELPGGWARWVPAWHTAVTPDGTPHISAGLVVRLGDATVYHLGDTCLFSDLALPGRRDDLDVALMNIGGHYTMDRHDAVAAAELVGARTVIPCHYDTFPPIEADAEGFKRDVEERTSSSVVILQPGETHSV